jgi:hypothetical protein
MIVGPGAAHAPGLPFFELRLVQVCAHLLLVRPSVRAWRSPGRGDDAGLLRFLLGEPVTAGNNRHTNYVGPTSWISTLAYHKEPTSGHGEITIMTTVLILVALMLVGSAIWGWRVSRQG